MSRNYQDAQEIYSILNELKDQYSIPFILQYEGYEYKEIAQHLGLPIGTVKSRLYTALECVIHVTFSRNYVMLSRG